MPPLSALAFFLMFFAGTVMAFARGPIWGLFVYVGVFYVHPPSRWWGDEIPDLRWSFSAAIILLLSTAIHYKKIALKEPWYQNTPAKLLIAYAAWMWVQYLWAVHPDDHLEGTILFTKYIVLFYLVYLIIDTKEKLQLFALAHVLGCGYLGWQAYEAGGGKLDGVGGPGIDEANRLGTHLGTGVMYAAMFILVAEQRIKLVTFAVMPLILNGIILTLSRGAFLGMVAGGISLWRLQPKSKARMFKIYGALGVVLFMLLAHDQFWARLGTLTAEDQERDSSASSRLIFMEAEWELFKDYPMGKGHRAFQHLSPIYLAPAVAANPSMNSIKGNRSSHNMYMAILGEQGIPGAIIWLGLMFWVWRTLVRLKALDKQGLPEEFAMYRAAFGGALIVVAVAGLFSNYFRAEVQVWALVSLLILERLAMQHFNDKKITQRDPVEQRPKAIGQFYRPSNS
ncbi:MAG: hypothetical protein GYB33_19015 [Gammaproteobacteria bacterium]|nr:hypothetical protein [Gammaproteobacteria bacterium]